ncbi:hypothetical protein MT325_m349R [Paramecium bursaria chlorella virus MT325]|uniref:Uncharacterized protein m349R n=1 Tax=Paramecium bursaria Chlorella virus MT325 TaxID=346932 RepID=A7IU79_PBCVM|nr:hypothetical protein MT325_m349R [Paramecium bursaria chlorella virus MT325]
MSPAPSLLGVQAVGLKRCCAIGSPAENSKAWGLATSRLIRLSASWLDAMLRLAGFPHGFSTRLFVPNLSSSPSAATPVKICALTFRGCVRLMPS